LTIPRSLPDGVYEELVTEELQRAIESLGNDRLVTRVPLSVPAAPAVLARLVARELEHVLSGIKGADANARRLAISNRLLGLIGEEARTFDDEERPNTVMEPGALLHAIYRAAVPPRPEFGLATSTLLTRARNEPQLAHELAAEIATADRIDVIVAFITIDGIRSLAAALDTFATRTGARMRVLTTVFGGITGVTALDALARRPGTEVKVSFDTRRTRLHAKAWLFHRESGLHAAYVGSANLTQTALASGHEWMVKASAADLPDVVAKFAGTFEVLWNDAEFEQYEPSDGEMRERVQQATEVDAVGHGTSVLVTLRPYEYQAEVLERLVAERELHGRHRNLVVAATGTGKTVIAAFDYTRWAGTKGSLPRMLFVAHRREILEQACATFRHALGVGGFGEMWVDGRRPKQWDHVFASVQSASEAEELTRLGADHFQYVVIDECHHATASSYQRLIASLRPEILLGLTATPERADGTSLLPDFCDCIAAELRLWHALERELLVPFEYFGINDDVDLSEVKWSRTGYDAGELAELYAQRPERMNLVVGELARRVTDVTQVRALAFCASVEHARFTAAALTSRGVPAIAIDGTSSRDERDAAPTRLRSGEINVICTCDLYNEGVDLPFVDTLLLLRPTQSATVMLQQLGRGLRLHPGKRACLVLDFIGRHRKEFRYDAMYAAFTGLAKAELKRAVETDFPWLPSGCVVQLDSVARDRVLESLRRHATRGKQMIEEVRDLAAREGGTIGLRRYLEATGRELEEVYRKDSSWSAMRRAAGLLPPLPEGAEDPSLLYGRLLHVDEPSRLRAWSDAVARRSGDVDALRLTMLGVELRERGIVRAADEVVEYICGDEHVAHDLGELAALLHDRIGLANEIYPTPDWPLALHRHYSRREIMTAVGINAPGNKTNTPQGGIRMLPNPNGLGGNEILLVTLDKSDQSFTATTRYRDYAISPTLFHWETQGAAAVDRASGRRYLDSPGNGWRFHLFVRSHTDARYAYLGPAELVSHEGSRPIAITWRLTTPMPASLFDRFASLTQG
jgi:superfamily II DNA or RNA helicase